MSTSCAGSVTAGLALLAFVTPLPATASTPTTASSALSAGGALSGPAWVWPLQPVPTVVRGFGAPADPWNAGHRGVDLLGTAAQPVRAIGAGDVRFASTLAGRGVVVIGHGALRSTYEPVTAAVHVGEHVASGRVVGLLQATHSHCAPQICLHLGVRRGNVYLDPLNLLGPRPVRLKPLSSSDPGSIGPVTSSPSQEAAAGPRTASTGRRASTDVPPAADEERARALRALTTGLAIALTSLLAGWGGRSHARG